MRHGRATCAPLAAFRVAHTPPPSLPPLPTPGFVEPGSTYRGDASAPREAPALFRATKLSVPHDPADYEVKQVGGFIFQGL